MSSLLDKYRNAALLRILRPGDAIEIKRSLYSHWALYAGEGKVIHLTGDGDRLQSGSGHVFTICGQMYNKAWVRMDDFYDVVGDSTAKKNNKKDGRFSPKAEDQIVEKAKSMIGKIEYNALWNNCEHFVSYCRSGVSKSDQADNVLYGTKFAGAGALFLAAVVGIFIKSRRNKPQKEDD